MTKWKIVKFGDIVRQVKDKVDPQETNLERYVAGEHMDTDNLHITRWGVIGKDYLGPAFHMRFKPGQILYGSRRTYLRKVAVADFEGITANTTYILESKDPEILLPDFLPFIMQTDSFNTHSVKQSKGSVNPYINFSDIEWYEFPLPPLDEQRRIATLLWSVENVRIHYSNVYKMLDRIDASYRTSVFTKNYNKILLGYLIDNGKIELKTGPFGTILKASSYKKYGIPVVNPVNMRNGKLFIENGPFISDEEAKRLKEYIIFENDLVFGRKGDIGRGVYITQQDKGYILGSDCIRIRILDKSIAPKYLFHFLTSPQSVQSLLAQSHGTTMPGINEQMLARIEISFPEYSEQLRITNSLDQLYLLKNLLHEKINMIQNLKKQLLQELL